MRNEALKRTEESRTISFWRMAVALPHSAISPSVRPQPVQTLALRSSLQISLQGDGGRFIGSPEVDVLGISLATASWYHGSQGPNGSG